MYLLTLALSALAADAKLCTVDFQRALENVAEGATARARLEGMYSEKKAAIEKMGKSLEAMQSELQKQSAILSDTARQQKEEEFMTAQMQYQQAAQRAEGEM